MKKNRTMKTGSMILTIALILLCASCAARGPKGAPEGGPAEAMAATQAPNSVESINAIPDGAGSSVVVMTTEASAYTVYKLQNPNRVILDVGGATIGQGVPSSLAVNNAQIKEIQVVGAGEQGKPVTRIVVNLVSDAEYDVRKDNNKLTLSLVGGAVAAAPETPMPVAPPPPVLESPAMEAGMAPSSSSPLPSESLPEASAANLPAPSTAPVGRAHKILDIVAKPDGSLSRIVIVADGSVGSVDAFTLNNPPRIVVDLIGLKSVYPQTRLDVGQNNVSAIRVGKHADKVRLVIDLAGGKMLPFTSQRRGDQLVITVGEGAEAARLPDVSPTPSLAVEAAPPSESDMDPVPMPAPALPSEAPASEEPPTFLVTPSQPMEAAGPMEMGMGPVTAPAVDVLGVDFDFTAEKSTVRIKTTGRAEYEVVANDKDMLLSVRVKNGTIQAASERSLDTSEFASPIRMVSSYQWASGQSKDVYVTMSLNFAPKYYVVREGNDILFIAENPKSATGAPMRLSMGAAEYAGPSGDGETAEADPESTVGPGGGQYYGGVGGSVRRTFSGRVVYLDYQRINVVDALSLLAEVAGLNLVVSGDLKGTVSLKLESVPWDQALDIVLRTQKYGAVIRGNIMRVAPLTELEEEEKKFQERKLTKIKEIPLQLRIFFVSYADPGEVGKQIANILTPLRGKVEVDKRTNSLLVWDVPDVLDEIQEFIKRMDIETPQVLIEARIVEARANITQELGVNWGGNYHSGAQYGNPTGMNFPGTADVAVGLVDGWVSNGASQSIVPTIGQTAVGISLGSLTKAIDLDLLLRALELEDKAKIISSPRILTLDSERAEISQGVAIPFSTTSAQGTKTEFIDANLKIEVTPHVTADRRIIMEVIASNNAPVTVPGAQGPGINKAEATTKILVKDGDTAVIGGIFVVTDGYVEEGVPLLRKVPFIGWMFRERRTESARRELLIFITPRIVSGGPEYMELMRTGSPR